MTLRQERILTLIELLHSVQKMIDMLGEEDTKEACELSGEAVGVVLNWHYYD